MALEIKDNSNVNAVPAPCVDVVPGTDAFAELCRCNDHRPFGYRVVKRVFDIAFSSAVIVLAAIPCAVLSVIVAAESKASPIYAQKRAGYLGKPFHIYKFRSMVRDADDVQKYFNQAQLKEWRDEHKVTNDPRITRLGRVLRKTSLDELPQFLNVFAGQISLIGPRVVSYEELDWYSESEQIELLSVPQGLTGWWQVTKRNEATFRSGTRQSLELEYVRNAGIGMDARIFAKTFGVMFGKRKTGR